MAKAKQKVTIPAMAGWTILEAAQHHGLLKHVVHADPSWDYNTFGDVFVDDQTTECLC